MMVESPKSARQVSNVVGDAAHPLRTCLTELDKSPLLVPLSGVA